MEVESTAGAPPVCKACRHPHFPENKCPICGHHGKGKMFTRYEKFCKSKGPTPTCVHFVSFHFDGSGGVWKAREKFVNANKWSSGGYWTLGKMMRHQVFMQVANGPRVAARDDPLDRDPTTLHFLALTGDAPVAYARCRAVQHKPSRVVVTIEHLLTMPLYRRSGIATRLVQFMLQSEPRLSKVNHFVATCKLTQQPAAKLFSELGFKAHSKATTPTSIHGVQLQYIRPTDL